MKTRHTYELDYENTFDSATIRVTYTYLPASEDHYDKSIGGPGGWTPGDSEEIEIVNLEQAVVLLDGSTEYVHIEDRNETICKNIMGMYEDDLRQEAFDGRAGDEDRAYDEDRDRQLDNRGAAE